MTDWGLFVFKELWSLDTSSYILLPMKDPTRLIADGIRIFMARLARVLNKATRGTLRPAHITTLSFLGHIPAAWALWTGRPVLAAVLIIVFGLMDSLDGALAREQNGASRQGMLFDAVTDRMKEILLYTALVVYTTEHVPDVQAWVVVAVAGTSVLVSYVKAKGEMALASSSTDAQELNRTFDAGIARYEVRMALLVAGLLLGFLAPLLRFIIALNLITAALRFVQVSHLLSQQPQMKKHSRKITN